MSDSEENFDLHDASDSDSDGYKPAAKKVRVSLLSWHAFSHAHSPRPHQRLPQSQRPSQSPKAV